jgi:hypothetical protein
MNVPVLFLVFNRPETTQIVFEAIRKARPPKLYVAADGPRESRPQERELCEQTRSVINAIDWPCEVKTLFREHNLGCKIAVSSAIDWFFEHEEMGIILEDDCLPSGSFFDFCEQLLHRYKDDERVMHISGCTALPPEKSLDQTYYFIKYPIIWGWAGWRRAWKKYDVTMSSYPQFRRGHKLKHFISQYALRYYWTENFDSILNGKSNTWDYQWFYTTLNSGGLCIVPNYNLVTNIGFGGSATHTSHEQNMLSALKHYETDLKHINHPNAIEIDKTMQLKQDNLFIGNWINRLKRTILYLIS